MDNVRRSEVSPVDDARSERRRKWRRRFLLRLPEISVGAVVVGLVVAGFQLLGSNGSVSSSSGSAIAAVPTSSASQVYSVDQVLSGLQLDPSAWMGQSILVQGVLEGPITFCGQATPCPPEQLALMDNGNGILASDQYLPISSDNAPSLPYNVTTTFKVQLQAAPDACALNPAIVCFAGTNPTVASLSQ
jgi:hypothetical protein